MTKEPIDTTIQKPVFDPETGEQAKDEFGQPKFTIARMKEATLSILGALFLSDHQTLLIKKIFGVMDTGGDG